MNNVYIEKYKFLECSYSVTFLPLKVVKDLAAFHHNGVMKHFSFKIQNSSYIILVPKVDSGPIMLSKIVSVPVLKPDCQEITR